MGKTKKARAKRATVHAGGPVAASETTTADAKNKRSAPAGTSKPAGGLRRLQKLNRVLAVLFILQAVGVLVFGLGLTEPLRVQYAAHGQLMSRVVGNLSLATIVGISLAISGAFHVLYNGAWREQYRAALASSQNPFRWLGDAFAVSLLAVAVGLELGLNDISTLVLLLAVVYLAHILGWQFEQQEAARKEQDVRRTVVMLAAAVAAPLLALGVAALAAMTAPDGGLVLAAGLAYASLLAGASLTVRAMLQLRRGMGIGSDYLRVEWTIAIGGAIAKSAAAWLTILAAIRV